MKRFTLILAMILPALTAAAQDLHESFTVLGEYIPDVIRQDKIHTLPEKVTFTMPASSLPYATAGLEGRFTPSVGVVDPPLWRARLMEAPRGYLDFGMGNYLNMTGSAGCRLVNSHTTQAALWLQHNSWWGFRPQTSPLTPDYQKRLTDDRVALHLSHTFSPGTLSADIQYRGAWFNYYGSPIPSPSGNAPTQTIVNPSASLAWKAADNGPWTWQAALRYHYFSFRRLGPLDGQKENALALNAAMAYRIDERSSVAVDVEGGAYLYSDPMPRPQAPSTDYGLVCLTPRYRFCSGALQATAGASLGLALHAGRSVLAPYTRHSQVFHAAPYVELSYSHGMAALSLRAKGGLKANTLQSAADADLYTTPVLAETTPLYSPVDASIALALNPLGSLSASFHINYAVTHGLYPGGAYMPLASGFQLPQSWLTTSTIKGFMFGTDISLTPARWCSLDASFDYSPQHADRGYFNGYDRPRWLLDATATFHPTDRMALAINYNYRGVRYLCITDTHANTTITHLRDLTYLNARASWRLARQFTLWAQVRNILGCRADILPAQAAPGVTFTAGFLLNF